MRLVGPAVVVRLRAAVPRIAQDRVAMVGEMDADLIAAARFEPHLDDGRVGELLLHAIVRDRQLAARLVARRVLIEALAGGEVRAIRARVAFELAGDDGDVQSLRLPLLELLLQRLEHALRLGEHEHAAHAAVEPMDHERFPAAAGVLQIVRHSAHERIAIAAALGFDGEHVGRLVDDDQVRVLEDDRKRGILPGPFP